MGEAMDEKKLSIIIPLHNVEGYVHKAADSIAAQSFASLEVIAIDDGSTDASLDVCTAHLAGIDTIAIRQENTGPGGARNAGLRAASGEYILFLDSDDFLLPGALEKIASALERDRPDVLYGRYLRWTQRSGFLAAKKYDFAPPDDAEKRTEYILGALPEPSWNVWRYVCRREFLAECGIFFENSMLCEDVKWVLALLDATEKADGKISYLPEPFYAYNYKRTDSIMNSKTVKRLVDLNTIIGDLADQYRDRPGICKALIRQSFFYINEYCTFKKPERRQIHDSYKKTLPRYALSSAPLHRIARRMGSPPLFYLLSVALYAVKRIRRALINISTGGATHL